MSIRTSQQTLGVPTLCESGDSAPICSKLRVVWHLLHFQCSMDHDFFVLQSSAVHNMKWLWVFSTPQARSKCVLLHMNWRTVPGSEKRIAYPHGSNSIARPATFNQCLSSSLLGTQTSVATVCAVSFLLIPRVNGMSQKRIEQSPGRWQSCLHEDHCILMP